MERHLYTGKVSKGSILEKNLSAFYHQHNLACLVSPKLLRRRGLGQLDICYFDNRQLYLVEAKHCGIHYLAPLQFQRIAASASFLASIFNVDGIKLIICSGEKSLHNEHYLR